MQNKEKTISVSLFEKNARIHNKKNLKRSLLTMSKHSNEYLSSLPIGLTNECIIEVNVDKSAVDSLISLFKDKGYRVVGTQNLIPVEITIKNIQGLKNPDDKVKELLEKAEADYDKMLKDNQEYIVDEVEDAKFIISPKKDGINTILEFIQDVNLNLKKIADTNDITILLYVTNTLNNLTGAIAYNFMDEDSKDNEVVEFYTSFVLKADLANPLNTYLAGYASNYLCDDASDFEFLNLSINAVNLKFNQ